MLRRFGSVFCAVMVLTAAVSAAPAQAVEGGTRARTPTPRMVSMQTTDGHLVCGGTLIGPQRVLTAFHCVAQKTSDSLLIRVGSLHRTQGGQQVGADTIARYPAAVFDPVNHTISGTDLGLIKLAHPLPEMPLESGRFVPGPGKFLRMLGWGSICTANGCGFPDRLQELSMPAAGGCATALLCVVGDVGIGVSPGDSGGPAVVHTPFGRRLVGVVHGSATDSARDKRISTFTATGPYRGWICSTLCASQHSGS